MDEKNNNLDELNELKDFASRYNHYLQTDEDAEQVKKIEEYEDISSFSGENADVVPAEKTVEEAAESAEEAAEEPADEDGDKLVIIDEGNFFTRNHYHNTKIIALCLVIVLLLTSGGFLLWIYFSTRSGGYEQNGIDFADNIDEKDYIVDDDHDFEAMGDIDANSLNKYLYEWANNGGEKMYSKNIINVLLCGVDSIYNLCDAQILVSVNKKTEEIKMVSFLRDSWTYIKMPRSDGTTYDYYNKVNAAYHGGPATLMTTIENNYKIKIDEFIVVDFESFPKLIDALGGVTVDVQQYESDYIRRTSKQKDFPVGTSKLNGKQALIYSRIRKSDLDNDLSRTRRQRSVIKGLIESAKTATKGQLVNAFKQVSGYLRTGYSQSEVISLIAQAYSHDWMNFKITEITMPNEDYVERIGGYIGSAWAWTVDYPVCAQKLQKEIYGESNIFLNENRVSALDYVSNKKITSPSSSSGSGSGYSYSGGSSSSRDYDDDDYTYSRTRRYVDYDEDEDINNDDTPDYSDENESGGNDSGSGGGENETPTASHEEPTQGGQDTPQDSGSDEPAETEE